MAKDKKPIVDAIQSIYKGWIDGRRFPSVGFSILGRDDGAPEFYSITDFIAFMLAIDGLKDDYPACLNYPLIALLTVTLTKEVDGKKEDLPIMDLAKKELCENYLSFMLSRLHQMDSRYGDELKSGPWAEDKNSKISELMFLTLVTEYGMEPVRSFFYGKRNDNGFYGWHDRFFSWFGTPLKTKKIENNKGCFELKVIRYEDEGFGVTGYEWEALFKAKKTDSIPAVAICGMVYKFVRDEFGYPRTYSNGLLAAADAVADTDVFLARSFIDQHDSDEIIMSGDLCFVTLWERRDGESKGLGKECIELAFKELRKKFPKINNFIFKLQPEQFTAWDLEKDPPLIESLKMEAIESLETYISAIKMPKWSDTYHIIDKFNDTPEEAMRIIAAPYIERMRDLHD